MIGLASGRYNIIRGGQTDYLGDPTDASDETVAEGVLGSVTEQTRRVFVPADNRILTVHSFTGRFKCTEDVRAQDKIEDVRTGQVYVVESVVESSRAFGQRDLVVDLTRN